MTQKKSAPFGSWKSPIDAAKVAEGGTGSGGLLSEIRHHNGRWYWIEPRPREGGRHVLMVRDPHGVVRDSTPPAFNARTQVFEYGGGDYCVIEDTVYFSHFDDQRLYRHEPDRPPQPITPEPDSPRGVRFAAGAPTPDGRWLFYVRERHLPDDRVLHDLARIDPEGDQAPHAVADGRDFYGEPRVSPDGTSLAWLEWDHPNMPWDGTELWLGDLNAAGELSNRRKIAGGTEESIFQPVWSPDGILHFVSDRNEWWNIYRWREGNVETVSEIEAEIGLPQWVFGYRRYAFLRDGSILCAYRQDGTDHLGQIGSDDTFRPIPTPFTAIYYMDSDKQGTLGMIAGNFNDAPAVVLYQPASEEMEEIHRNIKPGIDPSYFSEPVPITFPTEGYDAAHGLFFPPRNKDYQGPEGASPPLITMVHGGPTSAARPYLQLEIQYWTSRGFAVVDVNYGGSTGYGRAYRERLKGQWGVVDAVDCVNAVRYLADQGWVDCEQLIIRGGSAGGWTSLCALIFHDTFKCGASYYGVADLEPFAEITHKFEQHYDESLIGPQEDKELYRERSPINHTDKLSCPVIFFQGTEDKIVPTSQTEDMVAAMGEKGLPYAYLLFEGEGHGFRRADTVERWLEAELYFYSRIFDFELADPVKPLQIENL